MLNTLLLIIPITILLVISAALNYKFNFKIEHALFLTINLIIMILILFGLLGALLIGYYFIILLSILSIIYLVINKYNFLKIFTPGITGFLFIISIFTFLTRNIGLHDHDEVTHWALATKYMHYSGNLYKGLQTIGMATFNFFITKSSSYSESNLYVGAWIMIWSAFLLPVGNKTWKEWKFVAIYSVGVYCLTGYITKNVAFHTDEYLAFLGGAIAAYWALSNKKTYKEYIIAIAGLLVLSQIKDSFGAVCSMCVVLFIIVNEIVQHIKNLKRILFKSFVIFLSPIFGYFISRLTMNKPENYFEEDKLLDIPFFNSIISSKIFIVISILAIVIFIALIVFILNDKTIYIKKTQKRIKLYYILLVAFGFVSIILIYKTFMIMLSSFTFDELNAFIKAWKDYFYHSSGGMINTYTSAVTMLIISFACIFAIKKEEIITNAIRAFALYASVFIIGILVLIAFYGGYYESGIYSNSISWERYTSTPFIMMLTYISGFFILGKNYYKPKFNYRAVFSFIILIFLFKYMPYPGTNLLSGYSTQRSIFKSVFNIVQEDADIIKANLSSNDTVFIASYENEINANEYGDSRTKWLKYEIAPIESSWNYYSHYDEAVGSSLDKQDYIKLVSQYDYFYIQSAGIKFYDKFGSLFTEKVYYQSNALYKVIYKNEKLELVPVYIDESRILN